MLDAEHDAEDVADRVGREVARAAIDMAFVGIGENGHLAFNDPPADFDTERPYLVVDARRCVPAATGRRRLVPFCGRRAATRAVSMSVRQILKSREIICVAPDARKARAVQACFDGEVSPMAPASILQTHANAVVYLDRESAALLAPANRGDLLEDNV